MRGLMSPAQPKHQLNPQQSAAVRQYKQPLLVLAGAGSGKTGVITKKIAYLISQQHMPPGQIVAVTFTNKAAREMQARVNKLVSEDTEGLTISTFHSLGLKLLRTELEAAGLKRGFTIFDSDDSLKVIKELMKGGSKDEDVQQRRWQISAWKNDDISTAQATQIAENALEATAADLYIAYQRQLKAYNAVDFDDLICLPLRILREHADVRQRWQSRIGHLLIDEYQDTNNTQYEFIKLLLSKSSGLTAVGDDDQSIYAWRGARPENLERLKNDFSGLQVIKLEQNYRSTGRILACANKLIANNPHAFEKNLWSELGPGDPIRVMSCSDSESEAETIVSNIIAKRFKHKARLGDFAILYRGNHQSRPLEKTLRLSNLSYNISGGQSFFDRAEVKDILAYLRLLTNPDDDTAFLRIINTPRRQIGASTLEKLGLYANDRDTSLFKACHEVGLRSVLNNRAMQHIDRFIELLDELEIQSRTEVPGYVVRELLKQIHYADWLRELSKDQAAADRRYENVEELASWIERMTEKDDLDLSEAVARIALLDMLDKNTEDGNADMINLMTLHAAKGLEFTHVYLVGFEEGLLPHQSSIDEESIEEERRLAYVGITRAQRHLTLSYTSKRKRYGGDLNCEPSRFIEELPREHLQFNDEIPEEVKKETGQANLANLRAILNQG
jgi:ATP-dependent DNA helicase Rep